MILKFTAEFCVMKMKTDAKFEKELTSQFKIEEIMFDGTEEWCKILRKTDFCFVKIFVYRLKNSNFIIQIKMAALNWRQNFLIYFENCQDVPSSHE